MITNSWNCIVFIATGSFGCYQITFKSHKKTFSFYVGKGEIDTAWIGMFSISISDDVCQICHDCINETFW